MLGPKRSSCKYKKQEVVTPTCLYQRYDSNINKLDMPFSWLNCLKIPTQNVKKIDCYPFDGWGPPFRGNLAQFCRLRGRGSAIEEISANPYMSRL